MRNSFAIFADELHPLYLWAVARLAMLAWSHVDAALASYRNQLCSNESTNCFCTHEFLLEWCGACGLRPPIWTSHDIFLQFDRCQTCSCGTFRLVWIGRGYPRSSSFCTSSWANSRCRPCTVSWVPCRVNSMFPTSWMMSFDSGLKGLNDWLCCRSRWRACRCGWFSFLFKQHLMAQVLSPFIVIHGHTHGSLWLDLSLLPLLFLPVFLRLLPPQRTVPWAPLHEGHGKPALLRCRREWGHPERLHLSHRKFDFFHRLLIQFVIPVLYCSHGNHNKTALRACSSSGLAEVSSLRLVFLLSSDDPGPWDPWIRYCPNMFQDLAESRLLDPEAAFVAKEVTRATRLPTICEIFVILVVWAATVWASVWTQFSILAAFCMKSGNCRFHWFSTPSYWREILFLQGQEDNR